MRPQIDTRAALGRALPGLLLAIALASCGRNGTPNTNAPGGGTPDTNAGGNVAPANGAPSVRPAPPELVALPDFTSLVERAGPAVVNVSIVGTVPEEQDSPLLRFFGQGQMPRQVVQGVGSGFIISADGDVLTNAHVVENADVVTVRLTDKRAFRAKVLGVDRTSDVAVLKIDARNLPTVTLGTAKDAKVGQWVVAIGSPYGFENTVTAGIVSAKARSLPSDVYVPFLQTDVPVNPGNSGGPLFNMRGEVIGINSQIFSTTGGFMGLSFAIPIDVAVKVKDQLIKHGHVRRGRLGVAVQDVTPEIAAQLRLPKASGALVGAVDPRGPADRAGIRPGDVIVGVDGQDVAQFADLPMLISQHDPGSTASVKVIRNGTEMQFNVAVDEAREPPPQQ